MNHQAADEFDNYSDLLLTSHALEVIAGQTWDTVVIGSGMGGLSAAAALAKCLSFLIHLENRLLT